MKRLLVTGLLLMVFILVWGFGCAKPAPSPTPAPAPPAKPAAPPPAVKAVTLKAISYKAPGSFVVDTYQELLKRITDRSKGELIIDFRGGPEVVAGADQPEALRKGVIDVLIQPGTRFAGLFPEALALPVTSLSPMRERENGFYAFMDGKFNSVNMKYVGRTVQNWFYWFTNKKVEKPQELKGQKIRSTSTYNPFVKAIGATPIAMDNTEIYAAMERAVIDGYITVVEEPIEFTFYEVTKYLIDHYFYDGSNVVTVMNLDVWNRLPRHLQDLVTNTTIELEKEMVPKCEKIAVDARQTLISKKVTPIKFSAEDAKWFRDLAYSSYYADMKAKVSAESYTKLMELLK